MSSPIGVASRLETPSASRWLPPIRPRVSGRPATLATGAVAGTDRRAINDDGPPAPRYNRPRAPAMDHARLRGWKPNLCADFRKSDKQIDSDAPRHECMECLLM